MCHAGLISVGGSDRSVLVALGDHALRLWFLALGLVGAYTETPTLTPSSTGKSSVNATGSPIF
jgi:hypothetical protein